MRAVLWIVPVLLVAACGSQSRPAEDDPWANYQPEPRQTYDENYRPPRTEPKAEPRGRQSADDCVQRAREAAARGRPDNARVEYQAAFRLDRWHVPANQGYQDLMLDNGLFDALWREYHDLWQANPDRGDAFYFCLRPLMTRRGLGRVELEPRHEVSDETIAQINDLLGECGRQSDAGDRDGAVASIEAALKLADWPILHRVRIELLYPVDYDALLAQYAARAEANPESGDALALHARVIALRDRARALDMLRAGYVLELPGFWLPFGLAELCREIADDRHDRDKGANLTRDLRRQLLGWYAAARDFYAICLATRPNDPDSTQGQAWVHERIKVLAGG
jgi:hypothetical protein